MPLVASTPPITTKRTVSALDVAPTTDRLELVKATKPRSLLRPRPTWYRINLGDCRAIAEHVSRQLTEQEACGVIGLNYDTWKHYKARHLSTIKHLFETARTKRILGSMEHIERAQTKDWRAADRILALTDPSRFGRDQVGQQVATNDALGVLLIGALSKVYGAPATVVSTSPPELPASQVAPVLDVVVSTSSDTSSP